MGRRADVEIWKGILEQWRRDRAARQGARSGIDKGNSGKALEQGKPPGDQGRGPETGAETMTEQTQAPLVPACARPLSDLLTYLRYVLNQQGLIDEYFSASYTWDERLSTTPRGKKEQERRGFGTLLHSTKLEDVRHRWICVFPVTGGSEGHYVHVDLMWQKDYEEGSVPLFLYKTFAGLEQAITVAAILARELDV